MEDLVSAMIGLFSGIIGFFLGNMLHPKNKALSKDARFWEEEVDQYRSELKRQRLMNNTVKRGPVASDAASATSDEMFVDGIMQILPKNLSYIKQFKGPILEYIKTNPDVREKAVEFIKTTMGGKGKQEDAISNEAL